MLHVSDSMSDYGLRYMMFEMVFERCSEDVSWWDWKYCIRNDIRAFGSRYPDSCCTFVKCHEQQDRTIVLRLFPIPWAGDFAQQFGYHLGCQCGSHISTPFQVSFRNNYWTITDHFAYHVGSRYQFAWMHTYIHTYLHKYIHTYMLHIFIYRYIYI